MNLHSTLKAKKNLRNLEISIYIMFFIVVVILFCVLFMHYAEISENNIKYKDKSFSKEAVLNVETKNLYMNFKHINDDKLYYGSSEKTGALVSRADIKLGKGRYTLATVTTNSEDKVYDCTAKFTIIANSNISDKTIKNIKLAITGDPIDGGSKIYSIDELKNRKTIEMNFTGISSTINQAVSIEAYKEDKTTVSDSTIVEIHLDKINGEKGFSCKSR